MVPIYGIVGKALLVAGILLGTITIFDYVVFLANNSGTTYVNPYEYVQYSVTAILILAGILLLLKTRKA